MEGVLPRPSGVRDATLLVLAAILAGLIICELGVRVINWYGTRTPTVATRSPGAQQAMRYVNHLPLTLGTDRQWFLEDPPPLPNRSMPNQQSVARAKDLEQRGILTLQADYVWNQYYIESERCSPNRLFVSYPDTVLAFVPPKLDMHPRYRFPPNTTTAAGLVTNQFGWRGPPLELAKPPKTIRVAFLGASTTVGAHGLPFSYPERVVDWLNRFAQSNQLDVRFEVLNTGREGINSEDIAAITRDELLALDPDIAVYYEGSNQFWPNTILPSPLPPTPDVDLLTPVVRHSVPEPLRLHLASGALLDQALNGFGSLPEPRKPAYHLDWGAGVSEQNPDVDNPNLPFHLPTIVRDLDSIHRSLESVGAQLALCSFQWLAKDGMRLSPGRHNFIYTELNTRLWPLRYADIRRLADFQNRVFRRYAETRNVPFVDVASAMPLDPDLFVDAIHTTDTGERLKAWIVFQQLVPIIRKQIESGKLPRSAGSQTLPPPPSLATSEMSVRCPEVPAGSLDRISGGVALETIQLEFDGASLAYGRPVKVVTSPAEWSFAASIPVNVPVGLTRPCYLFLRGRVASGRIGLGVLDQGNAFQLEKEVDPSSAIKDIYVPILFPGRASKLMIRNVAGGGVRSEILIEDAALKAFLKPLPEEVIQSIPLSRLQMGDPPAKTESTRDGLTVTTGPGQGTIGVRVPLGPTQGAEAGKSLHAWAQVLTGRVTLNIDAPDGKALSTPRWLWPSQSAVEVVLPLPPGPLGHLVVHNASENQTVSKVLIKKIEILNAP